MSEKHTPGRDYCQCGHLMVCAEQAMDDAERSFAPNADLLAALESAPEPPVCVFHNGQRTDCQYCNLERWWKEVRAAALAKARQQSPRGGKP